MDLIHKARRRRWRQRPISANEMYRVLVDLAETGVNLGNGDADKWVRTCQGHTCVSVVNGKVRHDDASSIPRRQQASLTFAPVGISQSVLQGIRTHAARVLLVEYARGIRHRRAPLIPIEQ
jgi:hypothetical protein